MDTHLSRRRALALSGAGLTVGLAGCSGGNGDDDRRQRGQELRREDWEDVSSITVNGFTNGWVGVEPDPITDLRNPTLLLFEGREYELTWENRDAIRHNLELRDEGGSVIDGTQYISNRGERGTLEFTAEPEMHAYVCAPHPRQMFAKIEVVEDD